MTAFKPKGFDIIQAYSGQDLSDAMWLHLDLPFPDGSLPRRSYTAVEAADKAAAAADENATPVPFVVPDYRFPLKGL